MFYLGSYLRLNYSKVLTSSSLNDNESQKIVFCFVYLIIAFVYNIQKQGHRLIKLNKTKSIGVSEANSSCIWFLNGGIINSY